MARNLKTILTATLACVTVLAVTVAVSSAPAAKTRAPAVPGKANSIAELVARYDSSSCVECHQDVHDQWSRSVHSRSIFGNGRTAATFMTAIRNGLMEWPASGVKSPKDVKVEHLMGCAKCHLPQLADATDQVAQEIVSTIQEWQDAVMEDDEARIEKARKTLTSLNINCLVCHNRNAIIHKWTDGFPQKDTVYGSQDGEHADPKFTKLAKSPVMSESILCGQCHGQGPNFELQNPTQCATAYGSYLFAYIPEGGNKTCQQCHMRESGLGHDMQSYRSEVMAKKAVDMQVTAQGVFWRDNRTPRPKATVRVELTNHAGHGVPDG
jgi:Outer membrane cytochrome MtrC/MtrF-like, domains II/IV